MQRTVFTCCLAPLLLERVADRIAADAADFALVGLEISCAKAAVPLHSLAQMTNAQATSVAAGSVATESANNRADRQKEHLVGTVDKP